MSIQAQAAIRSKKLGVLIRDARLACRKTLPECASAVGTTSGILRAWEEGRRSPSLPELELLAYYLSLPMDSFWSSSTRSGQPAPSGSLDVKALLAIRQRFIGALLKQERENAGLSLQKVSELSGLTVVRLRSCEMGERPIPLPELEGWMASLGGSVESLFDRKGPVGQWIAEKDATANFLLLPKELQEFISKPINRPYLELAMKLSSLSSQKLRAVAENILDITY